MTRSSSEKASGTCRLTVTSWIGALQASHGYGLSTTLSGSVNLAVFDGDSNTNTKNPGWYGDNSGSLNYTITYLGL